MWPYIFAMNQYKDFIFVYAVKMPNLNKPRSKLANLILFLSFLSANGEICMTLKVTAVIFIFVKFFHINQFFELPIFKLLDL
jgi:hypothetical protein